MVPQPSHAARRWRCCCCVRFANGIAPADDDDPRPAAGIKDNSFLIEEAYNQEPGEIQHVVTLQRQHRDWFLDFSQEWALGSQTHQLGYSVPYSWLRSDGQRVQGRRRCRDHLSLSGLA